MTLSARPTVVCAWCDRLLSRGTQMVSHGICRRCVRTHMPEVWADLAREQGWQ
jgi:hypothetical protein